MTFTFEQITIITSSDYSRARIRGIMRRIISCLTRQPNQLLPFEQIMACVPLKGQHSLGLRTIPIDQIIGSAGRRHDFDRAFFPRRTQTEARWRRVDEANYLGVELPPVEVRKIGDFYFVMDGHHRISVARGHGQTYIDADVTEIDVALPINSEADLVELVCGAGA